MRGSHGGSAIRASICFSLRGLTRLHGAGVQVQWKIFCLLQIGHANGRCLAAITPAASAHSFQLCNARDILQRHDSFYTSGLRQISASSLPARAYELSARLSWPLDLGALVTCHCLKRTSVHPCGSIQSPLTNAGSPAAFSCLLHGAEPSSRLAGPGAWVQRSKHASVVISSQQGPGSLSCVWSSSILF